MLYFFYKSDINRLINRITIQHPKAQSKLLDSDSSLSSNLDWALLNLILFQVIVTISIHDINLVIFKAMEKIQFAKHKLLIVRFKCDNLKVRNAT